MTRMRLDSGRRLTKYGVSEVEGHSEHPTDADAYSFFAWGRDFETVFTNHKYTEDERRTLSTHESLDYLPSHSTVYRSWLGRQPSRLDWDRWVMMGLIGFSVGFLGFLLHQLIDILDDLKWDTAEEILDEHGVLVAWPFVLAFTLVCVLCSSLLVLLRPSAAGSGIPELIGFLNGTVVRHIFNVKTLVVKFFSCVLAVGGGLPVGPEGPMIHLGSLVGAGLSQFKSDTLRWKLPFFTRFRNPEDRRNFVSAGAAAGVASAFGAPVGGLLFSMEEVSSFWNMRLSWQTFFCCMVSTFTTDLLNSAFHKLQYKGDFGQFKAENYIIFQVHKGIPVNLLVFLPTALLGCIGGLLGGLFVVLNLKLARVRRRLLAQLSTLPVLAKGVRLGETLLVAAIFASCTVFLPAAFQCSSFTCMGSSSNGSHNEPISPNCLHNSYNPLHVEPTVSRYTCPRGIDREMNNFTWTNRTFNQAATLLFTTGERAIRHLFSRQTHLEFEAPTLVAVLFIYLPMACWSSGCAISSGLVVPMLLTGGLYGRLVGRAMVALFGVHTTGYWAWMDPGAFALIGAASFFGGVTRLTMSLTVIMMEITNDIQYLLPIMVAIMTAKWVGDFITHPLYHSLLELKCIPFLMNDLTIFKARSHQEEPTLHQSAISRCWDKWRGAGDHRATALNLDLFTAGHVMRSPVETVLGRDSVHHLADVLLNTGHGGFPVVRSKESQVFLGLITRLEIIILLRAKTEGRLVEHLDQSGDTHEIDQSERGVTYEDLTLDKLANPESVHAMLEHCLDDAELSAQEIDLAPFINKSALSLPSRFSLQRAFIIVRSLGLRHLTIVNEDSVVVGIVTRKDLMGFSVEETLDQVLKTRDTELSPVQDHGMTVNTRVC